MIALGRHRPLVHDAWSESAVRAAIENIAADAVAHFDPDGFWPGHPSGEGENDGDPSFYKGAADVIWALDYLHRIGATRVAQDFRPVLPKLLERTIADHEASSSAEYAKHGSLLRGDMGAALLAMRLAPTPSMADLVYTRAEAINGLPIRELMWGTPGHGTGGNGYAFLYRRTNDPIWLDRARQFAMTAIVQYRGAQLVVGRGRYSLWTGDVGLAVYLWDCITGEPRFPTIDVF
jgi:hypothetical protein